MCCCSGGGFGCCLVNLYFMIKYSFNFSVYSFRIGEDFGDN